MGARGKPRLNLARANPVPAAKVCGDTATPQLAGGLKLPPARMDIQLVQVATKIKKKRGAGKIPACFHKSCNSTRGFLFLML